MRPVNRWAALAVALAATSAACTVDGVRFASVGNECGRPVQMVLAQETPPPGLTAPTISDSDWVSLAPGATFLANYDPAPRDPQEFYLWVRTGPGAAPKGTPIPYAPLPKFKNQKYTVVVDISGDRCP